MVPSLSEILNDVISRAWRVGFAGCRCMSYVKVEVRSWQKYCILSCLRPFKQVMGSTKDPINTYRSIYSFFGSNGKFLCRRFQKNRRNKVGAHGKKERIDQSRSDAGLVLASSKQKFAQNPAKLSAKPAKLEQSLGKSCYIVT